MNHDPLAEALKSLASPRGLSRDETEAAVRHILEGRATESALAAFLMGLKVQGETAEELAGAVAAVLGMIQAGGLAPAPLGALDTCGTGGDGANTVNVSTATALVVAACGVPVVKHGNRAASGNSGSAEVLAELGVVIDPEVAILNAGLQSLGIAFLFAPKFHPGLRHAAPVRKALPFRTLFNLVGPLANPARPDHQLLGVPGDRQAVLVADALRTLGTRRSAVVSGSDGLDEVTLGGITRVWLVEHGRVQSLEWSALDFGLDAVEPSALRVSGPSESALRIRELLAGKPGPFRAIVLANAAAALWVVSRCGEDLRQGVRLASQAIDEGKAAALLERWGRLTRGEMAPS